MTMTIAMITILIILEWKVEMARAETGHHEHNKQKLKIASKQDQTKAEEG